MPIVAGEPTHIAVVQVYDGGQIAKDQPVRYMGEPDWKYRPIDPEAAAEWEVEVAEPARELQTNLATRDLLHPPFSESEKAWQQRIQRDRWATVRLA